MKIAITGCFGDVLPLFINLAHYLQECGEEVFFIDPQPREVWVLKKHGLQSLFSKRENIRGEQITSETDRLLREMMQDVVERGHRYTTLKRTYLKRRTLFARTKMERVVVWNGALSLDDAAARELSIDRVYLENGYFSNTLQIDRAGVNCQAEYSAMSYEALLAHTQIPPVEGATPAEIRRVKLNSLQCVLNIGLAIREPSVFFKKVMKYLQKIVVLLKTTTVRDKGEQLPRPFVFIPFQVYDDSQLRFNSLIVKSMDDILDLFYENIKQVLPDHHVVIKEHPCDLGRVNYRELQKRYPDVLWLKKYDVNELLEKAEIVITINSSVGLQAIARHKKVLILGDCFYRNNPFSEAVRTSGEFKNKLETLWDKSLDLAAVDEYIEHFKKKIFISGGLKTFTAKTLAQIYAFIKAKDPAR